MEITNQLFSLQPAVLLFEQYLKEQLGEGFVSLHICNAVKDKKFSLTEPLYTVVFVHKLTKLLFELELWYGGKLTTLLLGFEDGTLWTKADRDLLYFHEEAVYELIGIGSFSKKKFKYIIVPETNIRYETISDPFASMGSKYFEGYFTITSFVDNELDSFLSKIKEFCSTGVFVDHYGVQYDLARYIPFFNNDCKIFSGSELREYLDYLYLVKHSKFEKILI